MDSRLSMRRVRHAALGLALLGLVLALAATGPGQTPAASADWDNETAAFLGLINAYRQQNGAAPLTVDAKLQRAADWHSNDQLTTRDCPGKPDPGPNACDHTDTQGRDPGTRIIDGFGYRGSAVAENIYWAMPTATAQQALASWQSSDGHNRAMLNPNYKAIGIGRLCRADGWCFWTTTFGDIVDEPFTPPAIAPPATSTDDPNLPPPPAGGED